MMIVRHYITGIGLNSTVDKLVVVGVGGYQVETILGGKESYMPAFNNEVKHILCCIAPKESSKYFSIFIQYFIRNTERVLSFNNSAPHFVVATSWRNALYKAVGVKDYAHTLLSYLIFSLFASKPLM